MLLANSKLGVRELFTKLLQEPLSKCLPCDQRRLVIIDALDETEYGSREDFLDLIMHCFPLLPEWLVFFITSRPEDLVQFRLKKYNPCVKICAGNSDQDNFYQQHEQDIQTFLKKGIDFSRLSVTVEDISKKCNGLFLYAHYIVEELRLFRNSGKELNQLSDLFPGDIDSFFLQNFKRVYDQVGQDIFKKLFGCAIVAPSPLPVSIISYTLKREKSNRDEQQVIDAVSQFVVSRKSDQTLTFLHNLIPAWLTDKNKASRKLFIDKTTAGEYLRKVFVEILPFVVNKPPTGPSIDVVLKDYVSRVGVRFLCENGTKDSLKVAFDCLTDYHFIERRMKYGRIEIYHLLEDFRLAASNPSLEVKKQEILQEILFALEDNILVLLECPHLLHSSIRNASKAVRETVPIPQVSAPWLEWMFVYTTPGASIADMQCFATSPDGKKVVGTKGRSLLFFDASTAQQTSGPFEVSKDIIDNIDHLQFSPDGKFLFFGRLDKWFSVERGCVEDFPQFSGNCHVYKWGVFTRDGQYIVVKRKSLSSLITCEVQSCLLTLLALWAQREIEQSRDDELTVSIRGACDVRVELERLLGHPRRRKQWSETYEDLVWYDLSCHYCCRLKELSQSNQEPSLVTVRKCIIELYPCIFDNQVWDLDTGMPVLQQVFSQGIELNPFTYLCHVTYTFHEKHGWVKFSGVEKTMSLCNIATVAAFLSRHSYVGFERGLELHLLKIITKLRLNYGHEAKARMLTQLWAFYLEQYEILTFFEQHQELEEEWSGVDGVTELYRFLNFKRSIVLFPAGSFKWFHNDAFKIGVYRNIPKGFQDLVSGVNGEILTCVSPEMKWIIQADDSLKVSLLQTGNQEQHHIHHEKPEHTFSKFTRFTFTNDDLYFVYSSEGSLHALSLKTGTALTSVSGCNLCYFTRERQVGYLFRCGTEETAIFLTSLFSPFKFLPAPSVEPSVVGKSLAAMFRSSNDVMSVSSESMVTLSRTSTFADKEVIEFVFNFLLNASSPQSLHVKNCALSSDGRLIAIHREAKVELYSFATLGLKFLHSVFESKREFTVTCFAFSANSTVLLFCIQYSRDASHFYIWDIQEQVVSASFKSPGNLTAECCCLFSNKQALVLCGDYEIEIWEYAEHTCRLITRLGVEKPYNSVKFSQCTVSVDNQFLVCCIADVILVYSLHASNINSSKQVLRGHLGRIEFCRFLKMNRYLISYAVDGMVFLWDISEWKTVGFARIVKGQESIVSMAVSPEEDRAVCFTSSGRMCMVKLCELGSTLPLKPLTTPSKGKVNTAETSLQLQEQIASASPICTSSIKDEMFESLSSSESEEYLDFCDYEKMYESD